jgi:hypothetical protein
VAEQGLNHRKFRAIVEHVCGKAVPKRMRVNALGDARVPAGFPTGMPDSLLRNRLVRAPRLQTWK